MPATAVPANHPKVEIPDDEDEAVANCPYLTSQAGATQRLASVASNGGKVPRALWWVVFLDIFAVGLVIPLLPRYARELGAGPAYTGALGTAYGLSQLIGASVLGRLSDERGRLLVLSASLGGAALGYCGVALAVGVFHSLPGLFLSRLPIGVAKQTMTVARAVISDCTGAHGSLRCRRMSRLGMTAGAGFIFGPALGGILSKVSYVAPPLLAVLLFLIAYAVVRAGLPETAPARELLRTDGAAKGAKGGTDADDRPSSWTDGLVRFVELGRRFPLLARLLSARLVVDLGFMLMQSTFAMFTLERYDLQPRGTGLVLAYVGIVSVVTQGWFLPRVIIGCLRPSERTMLAFGGGCLALALVAAALSPSMIEFMAALLPLAAASSTFKTAAAALASKCVPRTEQGAASGATDAVESFCRAVAPLIGGLLMERVGSSAPGCIGGALAAVGALALWYIVPVPEDGAKAGEKKKAD